MVSTGSWCCWSCPPRTSAPDPKACRLQSETADKGETRATPVCCVRFKKICDSGFSRNALGGRALSCWQRQAQIRYRQNTRPARLRRFGQGCAQLCQWQGFGVAQERAVNVEQARPEIG